MVQAVRITTAAELDEMTAEARKANFSASVITDPRQLSEEFRSRICERLAQRMRDQQASAADRDNAAAL